MNLLNSGFEKNLGNTHKGRNERRLVGSDDRRAGFDEPAALGFNIFDGAVYEFQTQVFALMDLLDEKTGNRPDRQIVDAPTPFVSVRIFS